MGDRLVEGYVVNQRFQLLRLLGRGGMGSVWVARHLTLNIDVAIKFIDGALDGREDLRSRFAQEARTAARIQSPHVVNILDYGFDGPTRPFIAMELLQGEALAARLEREKRLPLPEVAKILTQAAKGLSRAHAVGVVHRDLKPDNLFLCHDDDGVHVKLLDFGIARDDTPLAGASHRTGTGQLLGTPAYMSPEQALGKAQIDFRSDLYSLAVVVYHCITGRLPFEMEGLGELIVSISMKDPPLPSTLLPVPPGLDSWFKCVFQKEPAARFSSAKEMAELFVMACRGGSSPALDSTVLASDAFVPGRGSGPDVGRFSTPDPRLPAGTVPMHAASIPGGTPGAPWSRGDGPPSTARWSTAGGAPPNRPPSMAGTPAPNAYTVNGGPPAADADVPVLPTRGAPPVVYALIGLVVVAGLTGGGIYMMKARGANGAKAGESSGLVGTADALGSNAAAIPSASASPSAGASSLPAPSGSIPPALTQTPAPTSTHRAHPSPGPSPGAHPVPPDTKGSPPPGQQPVTPKPAPKPAPAPTNDYGL